MNNYFNLIDEPWIPIAGAGLVSLKEVFESAEYSELGCNPVQKIALMKLFLAIAQSAYTPKDEVEWKELGAKGVADACLSYLDKWHDRFFLYGDKPFLQMPAVIDAGLKKYGVLLPNVSTGNTTVLNQSQVERPLTCAEKAMLLVRIMNFSLPGKQTDNKLILTPDYRGKFNEKGREATGSSGPSVSAKGLLHSYLITSSLQETVWLNVLAHDDVVRCGQYPQGIGVAPWECMPIGEDCTTAQSLKATLMGRLVALSRFCLMTDDGVHYTEGLLHLNYKEGVSDPTVAVNYSAKEPKALWSNPENRPWRELTSLLSVVSQEQVDGFHCLQLSVGLRRIRDLNLRFGIWSGGMRVSNKSGEHYMTINDGYVESTTWLNSNDLGDIWYSKLKQEMQSLDKLSKMLYGKVIAYFKEQSVEGKKQAAQASNQFWLLCERNFQQLIDVCDEQDSLIKLRYLFAEYVSRVYDEYCPKNTTRQIECWAKCRPNLFKYINQES